jgi:hypothetical protein
VFIPQGLEAYFLEVQILKNLVVSGWWLVPGKTVARDPCTAIREEREGGKRERPERLGVDAGAERAEASQRKERRRKTEELGVAGGFGVGVIGNHSKEMDYCQGTVP